jgi:hypothetical protein
MNMLRCVRPTDEQHFGNVLAQPCGLLGAWQDGRMAKAAHSRSITRPKHSQVAGLVLPYPGTRATRAALWR